jgi:ABC-type Mn2+/Zn2+ transport system ATPase subunit
MKPPACELREVWVAYGKTPALRGVSLQVEQGELLGLFGHNGAGKSTLLRTLLGLVSVQSGEVFVEGVPVHQRYPPHLRQRIGYVPQILRVDAGAPVSARDVVMMGQYAQIGWGRLPSWQHHEAANRALQAMGIAHLADKPFGHLSGGEQQRVLLARALAQSPRLLLMDEPTNSVDWQFVRDLRKLIREVHEANALTTIVVSHDAPFLAGLCDRVVLMEGGKTLAEMPASALLTWVGQEFV